jgi:uncharacterized protein (TIGR03435 family)
MKRTIAGLALLAACGLFGQPATTSLTFEAASVKPNKSATRPGMQFLPGGRFTATNMPLFMLIASAFDVPFQSVRLSGGPDWIRSERYDIEATAGTDAIPSGIWLRRGKTKLA